MTTPRVGVSIACASVLVSAPRMVLAILAADRLHPPRQLEAALLVLAAIGAVAVLGWGQLFLVHVIASTSRRRALLSCFAMLQLLGMLALLLPLVVSGLEAAPLHRVLSSEGLRWGWSVVTIAAPELLAVACVVAAATLGAPAEAPHQRDARPRGMAGLSIYSPIATPAPPTARPQVSTPRPPPGPPAATPCRHGCGRVLPSLRAERAHTRFCPDKPGALAPERGVA